MVPSQRPPVSPMNLAGSAATNGARSTRTDDGTGLQWLAVLPLGAIFAGFFLPACLLVAIGRLPRFTLVLGVCGLIAFAVVWTQLLAEFPKTQLH